MSPPVPQPTRWTREIASVPSLLDAGSADSIRLTTGTAIGSTVLVFVAALVGLTASDGLVLLVAGLLAVIFLCAAVCFWYMTSRDRERRSNALARERDLLNSLSDFEDRLGQDGDARAGALNELAEWIALRSRLNGNVFDVDAWRRLTHQHGTPMVVMLGLAAPPREQLAPVYEEIDLEQEKPGLPRSRLIRVALFVVFYGYIAWNSNAPIVQWGMLAVLLGFVASEFGFIPASVRSAVVSPGRMEISGLRRTSAAEPGAQLALVEHRAPTGLWGPSITTLRLLGSGRTIMFSFRHEQDARIAQFLASWLTPRASDAAAEEHTDESRSHRSPHGAVPASAAGPAGHTSA